MSYRRIVCSLHLCREIFYLPRMLPLTLSVEVMQVTGQGVIQSSEGEDDKKEDNAILALILVLG